MGTCKYNRASLSGTPLGALVKARVSVTGI